MLFVLTIFCLVVIVCLFITRWLFAHLLRFAGSVLLFACLVVFYVVVVVWLYWLLAAVVSY